MILTDSQGWDLPSSSESEKRVIHVIVACLLCLFWAPPNPEKNPLLSVEPPTEMIPVPATTLSEYDSQTRTPLPKPRDDVLPSFSPQKKTLLF